MAGHHNILIIGGGTAGITVAAQLKLKDRSLDVAIIEPSEAHYYQPAWTLVGAGTFDQESTRKPEADYIPKGVTWIKERVASITASDNKVRLESGEDVTYDYLVVAAGIQN